MAYTKDLGNVKGEDGDVYLPDISIKNGKLHFQWVKTPAEEVEHRLTQEKDLNIPVYVPTEMNNNGDLTFSLTQTVIGTDGNPLPNDKTFHVKGEKGDTGATAFRIESIDQYPTVNDIPIADRREDTIYVKGTKAWVYKPNINDPTAEQFFMLEGIDLSNYYTISQTYSSSEVNQMFADVTSQVELMHMLLDVENIVLN